MAPPSLPVRAHAVDALRGLGILGVVFGQTKPYGVLPAWMYHAQEPPPTHEMRLDLPGLTFPDLVFPFFLFTLGVAIPLALNGRLQRLGRAAVIATALKRGGLLVFLAWFRQHFDSVSMGNTLGEPARWTVALLAFPVLLLVFTRCPERWGRVPRVALRAAGWAGAAAMFAFVAFPDGSTFQPDRIDRILVSAAHCVVWGTLIWIATRQHLLARVAILAVLVTVGAIGYDIAWLNPIMNFTPAPWLYTFPVLMLLCIAVPGTIVGDLLLRWLSRPGLVAHEAVDAHAVDERGVWSRLRVYGIAGLLLLLVPLLLVGIQGRWVQETLVAAAIVGGIAVWTSWRPGSPTDQLIARLTRISAVLVVAGVALDLLEGGTQKLPPTFAWYAQSVGLGVGVLVALFAVIHVAGRQTWVQVLVDNGQNPMLAYVCYGTLVLPLLALGGVKSIVDSLQPWPRLGCAIALLVAVSLIVQLFSRRRILWRT